jgi:hypothetical protein
MATDTKPKETESEPLATTDGGLCRLDLPGQEPQEADEAVDPDDEGS